MKKAKILQDRIIKTKKEHQGISNLRPKQSVASQRNSMKPVKSQRTFKRLEDPQIEIARNAAPTARLAKPIEMKL
jgi:hypothetical protein